MPDTSDSFQSPPGFSPEALNVGPELKASAKPVAQWRLGELMVEAHMARDAFWFVVRRPSKGAVSLRSFPIVGPYELTPLEVRPDGGRWKAVANCGTFVIEFTLLEGLLHMKTLITPSRDLLVVFWPRDLYPLTEGLDPTETKGQVEAAQRGLNGGYCYLCLSDPAFGSVLYMQNLTELNDFFKTTKTKPDNVVGGRWPELGYQPPASPMANTPPENPLKAGNEVVISDVCLAFRPESTPDEFTEARNFIDMLADIYPHLTKAEPVLRDWLWRADKTLADLKRSEKAKVEDSGHSYFHPYVASEYPDSMVQMTLLATLREYEKQLGKADPLSSEIIAGLRGFYDDNLKSIRRYLPSVGVDKNKDAVDSWYLYHPLMNLARLAIDGEDWARIFFFDCLDYTIRAARHFDYKWPIIYNMTDFSVIQQDRGPEDLGQTDVGGIYAYVMLQAHQLTGDDEYLDEARKALKALEGRKFELAYQTNLTAWGAVACLKLWKLEGDRHYLDQSLTFVASFLHNCELWGSRIEFAEQYANFFGVTCLHDGPYMAAYEAFECFAAFDEYLRIGAGDLPGSVRLLLAEYWRYALDVLWSFYPDALPEDAISKEVRNGHIDRSLSFPLEDIYGDGSPAGQVGQEIYGAGSAFVVVARAYADCPGTPYIVFAEYPVRVDGGDEYVSLVLNGPPGGLARVRVTMRNGGEVDNVRLRDADGKSIRPSRSDTTFREFRVPSDAVVKFVKNPKGQG